MGEYEMAIIWYNEVLVTEPGTIDAHFNKGLAHFFCWKYTEAISDFKWVIEKNPKGEKAFFYFGASCYNLLMCHDALKNYNKAIIINKENATYFLERARAYNTLKQYANAISDLNETLKLKSQFAEAYLLRGMPCITPAN